MELRPYQEENVKFMVNQHRAILGDEPGLGKTLTTLTAVKRLGISSGPILVVAAPKAALGVWRDEAKKWYGWDAMVFSGDIPPHKRKGMLDSFQEEGFQMLIISYPMLSTILKWKRGWQAIICDEIHLGGLLNHKTAAHKTLKKFAYRYLFLLSGTPIRRGPQDLFAPLQLIDSHKFSSYWRFVYEHCIVIEGPFGKSIESRPKNPKALNQMLKQYLMRNTKKQQLKELPPKIRQKITLTMTKEQQRVYKQLQEEMIADIDPTNVVMVQSEAVKIIRLRQLLVAPKILEVDENGAAIDSLKDLAALEFDAGRSIVVCTPFRDAVPIIAAELTELTHHIYAIHGQMKGDPSVIARDFQACEDHKKVLIYTIKSGASFNAYEASTAFFVGYEWSAIDNLQAEDRLHRIGQQKSVNIYYFLYENTVDEAVMEKLDDKQMAANWILRTEDIYSLIERQRRNK